MLVTICLSAADGKRHCWPMKAMLGCPDSRQECGMRCVLLQPARFGVNRCSVCASFIFFDPCAPSLKWQLENFSSHVAFSIDLTSTIREPFQYDKTGVCSEMGGIDAAADG